MAITNWTGLGVGDLASTAGNWDNGAPTTGDIPIFLDGTGGICDWDVTDVMNSIDSSNFPTTTITQSVVARMTGQFRINGSSGQTWDTAGFDLHCKQVTCSGQGVIWNVATTLFIEGVGTGGLKDFGSLLPDVYVTRVGLITLLAGTNIGGILTLDPVDGQVEFSASDASSHTIGKIVTLTGPNQSLVGRSANVSEFTVSDASGVNASSDWENVTIIGGPITCNAATCNDLGGNIGINFVVDDLNTSFQGATLPELKETVDAWFAGSAENNIFTKAVFEVQQDVRTLGRVLTLTLYYNGGGGALTAPYVFNFLSNKDVTDINTDFEAFVAANPVAANFYGNMFVARTPPGRKEVLTIYAWINNTDQADAPTNWTAANDIT